MGKPEKNNKKIYDDEIVKIIGWAVTEGNYLIGKRTHEVTIFQKEGDYSKEIEKCLNNLNAHFKKYYWNKEKTILGYRISKEIANKIVELAPNKCLSPNLIVDLTKNQRMILVETMIKGDGWIRKNNKNKTPWSYCQKDKKHIDMFIMLCTLSGLTARAKLVKNMSKFSNKPYFIVNIYSKPKIYCNATNINFHGGRPSYGNAGLGKQKSPNIPIKKYKGTVWCPETEYGTFVCRRNGHVYITGNSYKDKLVSEALYTCIRYADRFNPDKSKNPFAYFTKVAWSSFIKCINEEKKVSRLKEKIHDDYNIMNAIHKKRQNNLNDIVDMDADGSTDWAPLTLYKDKKKIVFKTKEDYDKYITKERK